jgi:hypothetical protein
MPANFGSAVITQTGTNPCALTIEGINFSNGAPSISVQPSCTLTELLNTTFTAASTVYNANVQPTGWAAGAEAGFDYFRQLGNVTLSQQYNLTQAVTNTSFELDSANPAPATTLGYTPAGWTVTGAGAAGNGLRNATTVAGASPFGPGAQSILFLDSTGSSSGSALQLSPTFTPLAASQPAILSFDFCLNASGAANNLEIQPLASSAAGCSIFLNAGQLCALVNGAETTLANVTVGTWYRVQTALGPPSAGPATATLYLTPWAAPGLGQTTSYEIDSFGATQSSGFTGIAITAPAPGASENVSFDNITLNSSFGLYPASAQLPMITSPSAGPGTSGGQILLQWSAVPGASSYTIMRSAVAGSGYTTIATVSAPATTYLDSDPTLVAGRTYYYRVAATHGAIVAPYNSGVGGTPYIPPGIAGWRYRNFGAAGLNPTLANGAADLADPTSDGYCNLLKYALGMNPALSYSATSPLAPAPALQTIAGARYLTLTFNGPSSDLTYTVEFSSDFSAWQPVYTSSGNSAPGTIAVQDIQPMTNSTPRFVRLRVTGN